MRVALSQCEVDHTLVFHRKINRIKWEKSKENGIMGIHDYAGKSEHRVFG